MEEAQQIAADYITSLDNLPTEVKFLTEEIRLKETETMDLQNSVNRKILRANPRFHGNNHAFKDRDRDLAERIKPDLDRIEQLAQAKVELAERLVAIMTRTCGRLDHDLNRVRIASGEVPAVPDLPVISLGSRMPENIVENIKLVIPIPEPAVSPPPTPSIATPAFKRRRLGGGSINGGTVSNSPIVLSQPALPPRQSRLSNTVNVRPSPPIIPVRRTAVSKLALDENGEEQDESADDPADNEDKSLYCFCRKLSYGEMIGCDNEGCHYQWFHLPCVGLRPPLPETWYCTECLKLTGVDVAQAPLTGERTGRKSRKKQ
ncbi:Histone acetyltransferase complex subunit [Tulasnella sp. JGI-2019a]|nr:Histone acetyltransferase complex subunit [Tulasnella sp. JGI-2019a]